MLFITDKHTKKMEGMVSINTSTMKNPFCIKAAKTDTICKKCYAFQLEAFYSHGGKFIPSYKKNGDILSKRMLNEEQIGKVIKKLKKFNIVRFHAFGELLNLTHAYNYVNIAKAAPEKMFALWSKRADIIKHIKDVKPENLITIYSTPRVDVLDPIKPIGFDKVFTVYSRKFVKENNIEINCGGRSCISCQSCYKLDGPENITELLKREKKENI